MENTISFGQPDNTWENHNLSETPIMINGKDIHRKVIFRGNTPLAILSNRYQLLPNEEAVAIADEIAEKAGLVPFDKFTGPWIIRMGADQKHVINYGRNETRMQAMYAINEKYMVGPDDMYIGVAMHNSIDGSSEFGLGVFTFRQACNNMVIVAGKRNWQFYYRREDHGHTLKYMAKRHTKSLDPSKGELTFVVAEVMDFAKSIIDGYKQMLTEKVTQELIDKLKKSPLSKRQLPDYITTKEENLTPVTDLSQWTLYNDITAKIWHNPKSGFGSKEAQFNVLHKVMPLQVVR